MTPDDLPDPIDMLMDGFTPSSQVEALARVVWGLVWVAVAIATVLLWRRRSP